MNPDQIINLNQTNAECLHSAAFFGKQVIYNICKGTTVEIPWGGGDWALCLFLCGLGLSVIFIFFALGYVLLRDI